MEKRENNIVVREVKNYEEAYYYNLNPESREIYNGYPKNNEKKTKRSKSFLEFVVVVFEGILEIILN